MEAKTQHRPKADEKPVLPAIADVLRVLTFARPYCGLLGTAGALTLTSTLVSLSMPLIARLTLDQAVRTRQIQSLNHLLPAAVGLILLGAALKYAQYLLTAFAANRIVRDLRDRLFAHLLQLPVAFFDQARSGSLIAPLSSDVFLIQQTLTDDLVRSASYVVTLVGGTALTVAIDWRLTAVVLTLLTVMLAVCLAVGRRLRRMSRAALDALAETMGLMTETLSNLRLVKAFARETHEADRARAELDRVFMLNMRSSALEGALSTAVFTGFFLVLLGVAWIEGSRVLNGSLSAGSLLAFLMTLVIISNPLASLASQYGRWQRAIGAADRLFAVLDTMPEPADPPNSLPFPNGPGHVAFTDLDFAYVPGSPALCGLSLDVPAGRVTALVGASGAGKTTLALLLYRFYEAQNGSIRIDGVPIDAIRRQELRERIGLVPQEPLLFNGTIRENIRYGRLTATDAEVEAAARAANVEEFVLPLPKGYETVLGERGITLSGGQRQRVAIARALLKDPRILVLDEATSALDTHAERLVREALERLMRGRTTLVIAHRLTTVQDADQIAVLEGGRIAERGTHTELLYGGGRYAALHDLALT